MYIYIRMCIYIYIYIYICSSVFSCREQAAPSSRPACWHPSSSRPARSRPPPTPWDLFVFLLVFICFIDCWFS